MKIRESYGIPQQVEEEVHVPSVAKKEIQPINETIAIKKDDSKVFDPIIEETKDELTSKITNKENEESEANKENEENEKNKANEENEENEEKISNKDNEIEDKISNKENEEKISNQEIAEKTSNEDIVDIPDNKEDEDDIPCENDEDNTKITKEPLKSEFSFSDMEYKNQFQDFLPIYASTDLFMTPKSDSPLMAVQEQENITPLPQAHIQSNLSSKRASLKIDPQTIDSGTLS